MTVMYALIGNDVCNGHPDTVADMTTPEEMRAEALATLQYLVPPPLSLPLPLAALQSTSPCPVPFCLTAGQAAASRVERDHDGSC